MGNGLASEWRLLVRGKRGDPGYIEYYSQKANSEFLVGRTIILDGSVLFCSSESIPE